MVEDEDTIRTLLQEGLTALGYTVVAASNGAEALRMVRDDVPLAALLTDVVMPGMNGPELQQRLRARYPGLQTVFMSGFTDDLIEPHGVVGDEPALLRKPFTPDEAARCIRQMLDGT